MPALFTADGIARWHDHLNASTRFADASATWVGSLLFVEADSAPARAVFVRVANGRCTEARVASGSDAADAEFVLRAASEVWDALIAGHTTPTAAAMRGTLHLDKGSVFALLPHAKAAAELLAAAADQTSTSGAP